MTKSDEQSITTPRFNGTNSGHVLPLLLIVLAGVIAYGNSFSVRFVLDDVYSIEHMGKRMLSGHFWDFSIRWIADVTFAFNYWLHGTSVAGYHVVNLIIHLSNALLVYALARACRQAFDCASSHEEQSQSSSWPADLVPLGAALLFVLHPLQVQAVTYVIQRYTSLATLFYLLTVLLFLQGRIVLERGGGAWRQVILFAGALLSWLLALGTKQIAVTLPVMLIAVELLLFNGRLLNRRFALLCGVLAMLTVTVICYKWRGSSMTDFLYDLRHATSEDLFFTRSSYFLTQQPVIMKYLRLLVAPVGQSLVHDAPIYSRITMPVLCAMVVHGLLTAGAVLVWRRSCRVGNRQSSDVSYLQRLFALGIFWFYWALSLESSIFPIRDVMFEHRVYLPSAGFFLALLALAALLVGRFRISSRVVQIILIVVCLTLGALTIQRNRVWNNTLLLWQEAAANAPTKWLAQANLAGEYLDRKMPDKALPLLVRSLELNPGLFIRTKVALGETLQALHLYEGRFTTGQEFILPGGPAGSGELNYKYVARWDAVIGNNTGLAYEYLNNPAMALQAYQVAVQTSPDYDLAWYNLGLLAGRLGETGLARVAKAQLNSLNPALAAGLRVQ